jgi:hypothetical protein
LSNCDVVVRDLVQDAQRAAAGLPRLPAELASPSQQPTLPGTKPPVTCPTVCEGDADSTTPVVDANGSAVAYASLADNLLANGADNNHVGDVFKRTFKPVPVVPSLNFGNVVVHTPVTGTVTVSYPDSGTGFGPLHITGVTIGGTNGADFTVFPIETCTGVTLLPGDTCTVSIQFTPGDVGGRTGTLTITTDTNAQGRGKMSGNGTGPTLVVSPPLAPPGAVSQVSGTGWPPNMMVVVTLLTTPIHVTVPTSATGTFTVPLVIFPHTALGKKQLQAQVQAIPQISKTIDYLVVPGSLLPPDFAQRR